MTAGALELSTNLHKAAAADGAGRFRFVIVSNTPIVLDLGVSRVVHGWFVSFLVIEINFVSANFVALICRRIITIGVAE
jgi:hypothetical protein